MKKWTLTDAPDLTGKVIIVTGGNSGLGFESVKAFAKQGAEVIMACRNEEKGKTAKKEIQDIDPESNIPVMELDLMDLASIKAFAARFAKEYSRLDVLMNNAGIMMNPYSLTKDGFESQMGTNHLGHFALTALLVDVLIKTQKSRIVNISSGAHKYGNMDFSNLLYENGHGYTPMKAYSRSKLANLLFTYELQRRLESGGAKSIAVAAHPGVSETNLARYIDKGLLFKLMMPLFKIMMQNQVMGALPQIRASVDPDVKGGDYYGPDGFREMKGFPILVPSNKASKNQDDARRLWEESEMLTGIKFHI